MSEHTHSKGDATSGFKDCGINCRIKETFNFPYNLSFNFFIFEMVELRKLFEGFSSCLLDLDFRMLEVTQQAIVDIKQVLFF